MDGGVPNSMGDEYFTSGVHPFLNRGHSQSIRGALQSMGDILLQESQVTLLTEGAKY